MALRGSVTRYARFASRYRTMTVIVPRASARGIVQEGLRTSPEAKVMSCQESAENREPDCGCGAHGRCDGVEIVGSPEVAEVRMNRRAIPSPKQTKHDESGERRDF